MWSGIDDWPQFKQPSDFETRARIVYERLASAVEAARELIGEHDNARSEWRRSMSSVPVPKLATAIPPEAAASTPLHGFQSGSPPAHGSDGRGRQSSPWESSRFCNRTMERLEGD
jgi:hypothetical protein